MKVLNADTRTFVMTKGELLAKSSFYLMDTGIPAAEVEKAIAAIERAESRGFMACRAVFAQDEYLELWEAAAPDSPVFDWGRGQRVSERNFFRDGRLVRDPDWKPDPPEKEFEESGLKCQIILTGSGHRCGYAAVDTSHPWHKVGYDSCLLGDACPNIPLRESDPDGYHSCYEHSPSSVIEVHGGLTFANEMRDEGALWWFGFDCAHAGDSPSPEYIAEQERVGNRHYSFDRDGHHWTLEEVEGETRRLAAQIAAVTRIAA